MIIILEGPDGVGKSTLATELQKLTGFSVRHETRHFEGLFYYTQLVQESLNDIIFDRCYLGEAIYPSVLKDGRKPLDSGEVYMLEMALASQGAILVRCRSQEMAKNIHHRGDHLVDPKQLIAISKLYDTLGSSSILPSVDFDYKFVDAKTLLQRIDKIYRYEYGNLLAHEWNATGFVKHCYTILVGDKINHESELAKPWRLPFTSAGGCSSWFHDQLRLAGRRYLVTNELTKSQLFRCGCPKVFAMGKLAEEKLKVQGINFSSMPHPQYLKRFHHSKSIINETLQLD